MRKNSSQSLSVLNTGIKTVRNVLRYTIGPGCLRDLNEILAAKRSQPDDFVVIFIDEYFQVKADVLQEVQVQPIDLIVFVSTSEEPTTDYVDNLVHNLRSQRSRKPCAIVGIGGGITMDVAKAVSNLLTNPGKAEDYQGWDLVKNPGIYKIAVPTVSGTGAEATRTCVLTNKRRKLKLGMNSDFTVYDQIVMDPKLTATVPRNQYFYSGMDAYIHCIESAAGGYRNAIGDAYSRETINLCRQIFLEGDMMSPENRERMMVASYLGGCAIATSYVGLVHPFSAGLSVVLGLHHCVGNCIALNAMEEFYPEEVNEFRRMATKQGVTVPSKICQDLDGHQVEDLFAATIIHEKPLTNALGEKYKKILTPEKVAEIFRRM
jgi:3-deoxy-alpha-D-manno-octulosonate 8-oxidase